MDLGTLLYDRGDPVGAIAAYDAGIRLGSDDAALAIGRLFIAEHRIGEAEATLRRAVHRAPSWRQDELLTKDRW